MSPVAHLRIARRFSRRKRCGFLACENACDPRSVSTAGVPKIPLQVVCRKFFLLVLEVIALPGSVMHHDLASGTIILTAGAFLGCSPDVTLRTRFGGFRYLFSGEGAFFLEASGSGDLFFNTYGSVVEKEVDGELTVDTGHVVGWDPSLEYRIGGMGGLKQTLFSGEGLVIKFSGRGKIYLQTRTLPETSSWLSPFCVG